MQIHVHEVKILQIHNARPEFVKNITAINRDACNKICKTLSVVRFM
jgi:hypothetical protein